MQLDTPAMLPRPHQRAAPVACKRKPSGRVVGWMTPCVAWFEQVVGMSSTTALNEALCDVAAVARWTLGSVRCA